ncbi:hypothetical protein B0A66_15315 [Flavobacterium hercynium]|uniref:Uncharacterized protein n=1 Tax=Flavobacterium hercynium TaxID=387094 RepID=A0A226H1Z1_9FLAO|nr:hypothetical protein B0A66_15315 [Flavobacterium hercynium]
MHIGRRDIAESGNYVCKNANCSASKKLSNLAPQKLRAFKKNLVAISTNNSYFCSNYGEKFHAEIH